MDRATAILRAIAAIGIATLIAAGPVWADGRAGEEAKTKIPAPVKAKAKKAKRTLKAPTADNKTVQPVASVAKKETGKAENGKKEKPAEGHAVAPVKKAEGETPVAGAENNKEASKAKPKKEVAPPATEYVLFDSKPSNAEVVVNGQYAGNTPVQLPLTEGVYSVKLVHPGYEEWERKISVFRGLRVHGTMTEKQKS